MTGNSCSSPDAPLPRPGGRETPRLFVPPSWSDRALPALAGSEKCPQVTVFQQILTRFSATDRKLTAFWTRQEGFSLLLSSWGDPLEAEFLPSDSSRKQSCAAPEALAVLRLWGDGAGTIHAAPGPPNRVSWAGCERKSRLEATKLKSILFGTRMVILPTCGAGTVLMFMSSSTCPVYSFIITLTLIMKVVGKNILCFLICFCS